MKKFTKILIPVLVLSLLVGLFAVIATANDEIADTAVKGDPKFVSLTSPGEGESATDASYTAYNGENVEYRLYSSSLASKSYNGFLKVGEVTTDTTVADPETGALTRQYYYTAISFDIATANQWFPNLTVKIHGRVYKYNMSNGQQVDNGYGIFGALSDFSQFENDAPFTWHNVTILFDYSNGTWNLYIDGEFVKTATESMVKAGEVEIKSLVDTRFQPEWSGLSGEASMAMTKVTAWNYAGKSDLANLFDGTGKSLSEANVKLPYMTADDITPAPAAAAIGEKQYETLADAVAEWQKGDVIKLLRDVSNFYFETDAVVDTNGFSLGYDFSDDYNAFENDGVVTVQYYEDYEGSNFAYVVFQYPDGTVISRTEYSIPVGAVVPKSIIPADLTSPAAEYLGFAAGDGVNGELIKGKFYVENPVVVPGFGSETDNVVYFTAVPGQVYEGVVAAIEDADGNYIKRFTADKLSEFDADYLAGNGYKFHLLTDYDFLNNKYAGSILVLHGNITVETSGTNKNGNRFFNGNVVRSIIGVPDAEGNKPTMKFTYNEIINNAAGNSGTKITLENLNIDSEYRISDLRDGTLIIRNCTVTSDLQHAVHARGKSKLIVEDSTIACTASNGRANYPIHIISEGTTVELKGKTILDNPANKAFTLYIQSGSGSTTVLVEKDVVIKSSDGWGIRDEQKNATLKFEEGYTTDAAPQTDDLAQAVIDKFVTLTGAPGIFEEVDGKFVFTKAKEIIYLTFVVNGNQSKVLLVNGSTDYEIPDTSDYYVQVEGEWYRYIFTHWAATEGGEATAIDATKSGTYYAVFTSEKASLAGYVEDENGNVIKEYFSPAEFEKSYLESNVKAGYKYHAVSDMTFTKQQYGGQGAVLVIHGVTVTWNNPSSSNRFFYNGVNTIEGVTVNGVRGKLNILTTGHNLYYSDNASASLTFKNVDIETVSPISDARGGTITLIDSNLHCTGAGHALQMLHRDNSGSYSLVVTNSNISTYGSDGKGKYAAAVRLIDWDNTQTEASFSVKIDGNSKIFTTCETNKLALDITTQASTATLYLGKDVTIQAGNGKFGLNNTNAHIVVTIEEGFKWTAEAPVFTSVNKANFKVANAEGSYGYFKQVGDDFVWTKADKIVELTFDVNGNKITIPLIDGDEDYTAPTAAQTFEVKDGKAVITKFSHWSDEMNGAEAFIDTSVSGTYYAVFTQVEATWVVYGANDAILAAGAETMPADAINTTGAVKVVLYGDNTLDLSAGVKCVNDIVFDLSGKALTTAGKDRYNLGGCSVTFRNGTLNVKHGANLFYGAGNVYFETVTINSERTVIDFRSNGVISLTDCVVNHNSASNSVFSLGGDAEHTNFVAKNTVVNLVDTDFGTENDKKETIYFVQTSSMKREVQQKVFSTITFDNVTVNAGDGTAFRMAFDAGEESLVNIYLKNGTKIFTNRSVISDGGTANLLTVFHVDETVVLGVTGIRNSMRYELGEGKVLVYNEDKGGYVVGEFKAPTEVLGNLTLYTDINFNFFVAVNGNNRYTFAINGVAVSTTVTKINGKDYYRIAYKGIKVYDAAEGEFVLTLETVNGVAVNAELATCSVLDYAKIVLGSDMGVTAKTLVANVVDYIAAAYVYDTNSETLPDKLAAVMASEDYKAAVAEYNRGAIAKSDANAEGAKKAIASVQLNVTSGFKYRLNLASDYTGTLTVNGVQYNVENGKTGENTYIEITILACNMLVNNITVVDEANEINGSFDLEYYIEADKTVEDGKGELNKLLEALYYYCEAATRFEALARG